MWLNPYPDRLGWGGSSIAWLVLHPIRNPWQACAPQITVWFSEDENGDGLVDKHWRFAEGLTMIQGLEPGLQEGFMPVTSINSSLLRDEDGDLSRSSQPSAFRALRCGGYAPID